MRSFPRALLSLPNLLRQIIRQHLLLAVRTRVFMRSTPTELDLFDLTRNLDTLATHPRLLAGVAILSDNRLQFLSQLCHLLLSRHLLTRRNKLTPRLALHILSLSFTHLVSHTQKGSNFPDKLTQNALQLNETITLQRNNNLPDLPLKVLLYHLRLPPQPSHRPQQLILPLLLPLPLLLHLPPQMPLPLEQTPHLTGKVAILFLQIIVLRNQDTLNRLISLLQLVALRLQLLSTGLARQRTVVVTEPLVGRSLPLVLCEPRRRWTERGRELPGKGLQRVGGIRTEGWFCDALHTRQSLLTTFDQQKSIIKIISQTHPPPGRHSYASTQDQSGIFAASSATHCTPARPQSYCRKMYGYSEDASSMGCGSASCCAHATHDAEALLA